MVQKNYELAQQIGESEMSFDDYEKEDFKTHIYNLINKLPPQKREVCLLKIETDMTNQEIADHMNISLSTVKSHFTQLVKILRTKIEIIIIFGLYLTNFF